VVFAVEEKMKTAKDAKNAKKEELRPLSSR
jgi:hypothetical protein